VLQPTVEAFFLVHALDLEKSTSRSRPERETRESQVAHIHREVAPLSPLPSTSQEPPITASTSGAAGSSTASSAKSNILPMDASVPSPASPSVTAENVAEQKFLRFAERHRTVLNQILRQSTVHLPDGPFYILVDHTRLLDFDVKRRYFRTELERMDDGIRREDMAVHIKREHIFEDSFRELFRRSKDEWKNRFYIVFEGEEGQDAGGLLREWYVVISREIFNPMYALFTTSPGDRVTYMINSSSYINPNHLLYYKFIGRVIG
ncbi:unnamed protein product, partial [Cyprideis torosa]